jgi:hypothetical protein
LLFKIPFLFPSLLFISDDYLPSNYFVSLCVSESPGEMKGNRALIMVQAWRLQRGQQADTWVGRWWGLKQRFDTWVGRWAIPDLGLSKIDFHCSKIRKVETLHLTAGFV